MSDRPFPGRSLVSRRAVVDIVHSAVVTSYGVIGVDASLLDRLFGRLGLGAPGIRVRLDRGIEVDLHLTVGYGLPIAEVARQVDSAVRYAIRRSLGRDVHRLTVHVAGLRYQPTSAPPSREVAQEAPSAAVATDPGAAAAPGATADPGAAAGPGAATGPVAAPTVPAVNDPADAGLGDQVGRRIARARRHRTTVGRPDDA